MFTDKQVTDLNEMHQETYADLIERTLPDGTKFQKYIPFEKGDDSETHEYRQTLMLKDELGFSMGQGAFKYNPPIPGDRKKAKIKANDLALTAAMSIGDASQSVIDKKKYKNNAGSIIESMNSSMRKVLEMQFMYGKMGLAEIKNISSVTNQVEADINLTDHCAPAMFAGFEGLKIDFYRDGTPTKINKESLSISKISTANLSLKVKGTSEDFKALKPGDKLFLYGCHDFEMEGLAKILSTTSGKLFDIDCDEYSSWGSNLFNADNKLFTMPLVMRAMATAVDKGLDEDVLCFTNTRHWNQLHHQITAQRVFDSSYKKERTEIGSKEITYYGNNGMITFVPHIYTKVGDAFIFPKKRFKRLGYQDPTFGIPGTDASNVWTRMEGSHGVYSRLWTNQCLYTASPQKSIYIKGISSDDNLELNDISHLRERIVALETRLSQLPQAGNS